MDRETLLQRVRRGRPIVIYVRPRDEYLMVHIATLCRPPKRHQAAPHGTAQEGGCCLLPRAFCVLAKQAVENAAARAPCFGYG